MSTTIRAELSGRNIYWVEKHRYYELKHFCLQYPIWRKICSYSDDIKNKPLNVVPVTSNGYKSDPTVECAEFRQFYVDRMNMVEKIAKETVPELSSYILKGVTEGVSYDHLRTVYNIPCCKDKYYELYREFFYLLSAERK